MAARIEPSILHSPITTGSTSKKPKRIKTVVADDSETFLEVLCDVLDLEDEIEVIAAASDGMEALEQAVRLKPDLLLMDVHMPGLDGISAASLLTEMMPSPIVVLMSSEDSPELRRQCERTGAFAFINKMFFQQEFPGIVERVVSFRDQHWKSESA